MKIILAPDSFKGSLTSMEIIEVLAGSIERTLGARQIIKLPMADGGEGTVEALVTAAGGEYRAVATRDALGRPITAAYGVIHGDTALLEMAGVAGLMQLNNSEKDPLLASSRSLGELMASVMDLGYRKMLIGIGGSATNDGGMGMLAALGARFYDGDTLLYGRGGDLMRVTRVDLSGLDKRLDETEITVICDVSNPLLGETGATYVYGPQKGVAGDILPMLEAGMKRYADLFADLGMDIASMPGAGAAGGVGAALGGVLKAKMRRGIDAVLDAVQFDALLSGADLVVTGEGRLDGQSVRFGKVPAGIAKRCGEKDIPVAVIVGSLGAGWEGIHELARCSVMPIVDGPMPLDVAMQNAKALLQSAGERMFRFIGLLQPK
jgi:glycerate kinase